MRWLQVDTELHPEENILKRFPNMYAAANQLRYRNPGMLVLIRNEPTLQRRMNRTKYQQEILFDFCMAWLYDERLSSAGTVSPTQPSPLSYTETYQVFSRVPKDLLGNKTLHSITRDGQDLYLTKDGITNKKPEGKMTTADVLQHLETQAWTYRDEENGVRMYMSTGEVNAVIAVRGDAVDGTLTLNNTVVHLGEDVAKALLEKIVDDAQEAPAPTNTVTSLPRHFKKGTT